MRFLRRLALFVLAILVLALVVKGLILPAIDSLGTYIEQDTQGRREQLLKAKEVFLEKQKELAKKQEEFLREQEERRKAYEQRRKDIEKSRPPEKSWNEKIDEAMTKVFGPRQFAPGPRPSIVFGRQTIQERRDVEIQVWKKHGQITIDTFFARRKALFDFFVENQKINLEKELDGWWFSGWEQAKPARSPYPNEPEKYFPGLYTKTVRKLSEAEKAEKRKHWQDKIDRQTAEFQARETAYRKFLSANVQAYADVVVSGKYMTNLRW